MTMRVETVRPNGSNAWVGKLGKLGVESTAVLFLLMLGMLSSCRKSVMPTMKEPILKVAVTQVELRDLAPSVRVAGVMNPSEQIDVNPRSSGVLTYLKVDIGDYVRSGELIATLSSSEKPGELENVTAPFDGVVTRRYLTVGSLDASGLASTAPIVNIAMDTTLRGCFAVPESALRGLDSGAPLVIEIPEVGCRLEAKVSRISAIVDPVTRTMRVEADVPNANRKILAGSYAEALFSLPASRQVLTVPASVVKYETSPLVFVVSEDKKIEKRRIRLGVKTGDQVEIVDGLKIGELVVIGNTSELVAGEKVAPEVRKLEWTELTAKPR